MLGRRFARGLAAAMISFGLAACGPSAPEREAAAEFTPEVGQAGKDVIWVPTPERLVTQMLASAAVGKDDLVVDLGAGDGRIAIAAAREFGARARGIEFNPDMVALARRRAQEAGVADRVAFVEGDIFATDFSDADVVTLYLLPSLNLKLRPTLLAMEPGTRIVSHSFDMAEWRQDATIETEGERGYLWIVPAQIAGQWRFTLSGGSPVDVTLSQRFQELTVDAASEGVTLSDVTLRGKTLRFALARGGRTYQVEGEVEKDAFSGVAKEGERAPIAITGARTQAAPVFGMSSATP